MFVVKIRKFSGLGARFCWVLSVRRFFFFQGAFDRRPRVSNKVGHFQFMGQVVVAERHRTPETIVILQNLAMARLVENHT